MASEQNHHPSGGLDLVTGAFGNIGRAITELVLERGRTVRTLTAHPGRSSGGSDSEPIDVVPFRFDDHRALAAAFEGVTTFYNTYWMRTGDASGYETAVERSAALIAAAERAGVERIVHLSVAHPSLDSPYAYFRAKARVEETLRASSIPAAVVRPALVFGGHAPLLDNLAWLLRRIPVLGVAGHGDYLVRPVHVSDVARLCVDAAGRRDATVIDAAGPDRLSYRELVTQVRDAVGSRTRIVSMPTWAVLAASKLLGVVLRDELLTREELLSTMDGIADITGPATGTVSLGEWLRAHAAELGHHYVNERAHRRGR